MRLLSIGVVVGLLACGSKSSPCDQLQAKVCAGLDAATCKRHMATLEPTLANLVATDLGWRLYAPDLELSEAERTKACAVMLAGPARGMVPAPTKTTAVQASRDAELAQQAVEQQLQSAHDARTTAATTAAIDQVIEAKTATDRAAAKAALIELQKQKYELEQRAPKGRVLPAIECDTNPLAKGC